MQKNPVKAIGIPWYKQENYQRLKELFIDSHLLPDTFDEWLKKAKNIANRLEAQGCIVEKVDIDINAFPAWCRGRGLDINANARENFASELVARKYTNRH